MHVVYPVAGKLAVLPKPRKLLIGPHRLPAAVLAPVDVGLEAQYAGAFSSTGNVGSHKRPDVGAHAVVKVRFPTGRLLFDGLPAHENIEGRFTSEDGD